MLDEDAKEKLNTHANRLYTIEHCLGLLLCCVEGKVYDESEIEILSFGFVLQEYLLNTRKSYAEVGKRVDFIK